MAASDHEATVVDARYYDPTTGLFLSVDPLADETEAPYAYAAGDPTSMRDAGGLFASCLPSSEIPPANDHYTYGIRSPIGPDDWNFDEGFTHTTSGTGLILEPWDRSWGGIILDPWLDIRTGILLDPRVDIPLPGDQIDISQAPPTIVSSRDHPPVPEGQGDLGEWGAEVWGHGPEGARDNLGKTPEELAELGITIDVAEEWCDFYEEAAADGRGGATSPARVELMEDFIQTLIREA